MSPHEMNEKSSFPIFPVGATGNYKTYHIVNYELSHYLLKT